MMRDPEGKWQKLEDHLTHHHQIALTHSICEDCSKKLMAELEDRD